MQFDGSWRLGVATLKISLILVHNGVILSDFNSSMRLHTSVTQEFTTVLTITHGHDILLATGAQLISLLFSLHGTLVSFDDETILDQFVLDCRYVTMTT